MNAFLTADMKEATRLTREGRLSEATALLLGAQSGNLPSAAKSGAAERPSRDRTTVLDMVPPSSGTGNSWTAPRWGAAPHAADIGYRARRADPDGATFEERLYTAQAGSLTYKLYVPSSYTGRPVPLVVMLHGCTQSPDDFATGTRMNALAEEQSFLVAYPAQSATANISKCWNWFRPTNQRRDQGEPSLIAGLTRQIMQDFSVQSDRVHVAGLSAGGAAAAILGAAYPDLFTAVGIHSGLACGAARDMASAMTAMRQGARPVDTAQRRTAVPTIVFHGDQDTTVAPTNAEQIIAGSSFHADREASVSRGKSAGGMAYTHRVFTDGDGRPVLEHWVLHGAGHAWSGGSSAGSYTDPTGPDASREMLRFFSACPPKAR